MSNTLILFSGLFMILSGVCVVGYAFHIKGYNLGRSHCDISGSIGKPYGIVVEEYYK